MDAIGRIISIIGQLSIGLVNFILGYCPGTTLPSVAELINSFAQNPCDVRCGLLTYLALPEAIWAIGLALVLVGGMSVFTLLSSSVLAPLLAVGTKLLALLSSLGGGGGDAYGGRRYGEGHGGRFEGGVGLSPTTGLVLIVLGLLLLSGEAGGVVEAFFSLLSGISAIGFTFLITMVTMVITGQSPCG